MHESDTSITQFVDKSPAIQGKRNVMRRCPICDRGHSCFATAADLDTQVIESSQDISIGSTFRLQQDVVGSWHGMKTNIPDGTKVVIKNLTTDTAGGLRAMIELPNGDTQWVSAKLLGQRID